MSQAMSIEAKLSLLEALALSQDEDIELSTRALRAVDALREVLEYLDRAEAFADEIERADIEDAILRRL